MKDENKERDLSLTMEELDKAAGGEDDKIILNTIEKIENCAIFEMLKEIIRGYKNDRGYDLHDWNNELAVANRLRDKAWRNGYSLRGPVLKEFLLKYWPLV